MSHQQDILTDLDPSYEVKSDKPFGLSVCLVSILIIAALSYNIWDGRKPLAELIYDWEFQLFISMHVVYPLIALILFIRLKRPGWAMILIWAILNTTWGISSLIMEGFDITTLFFAGNLFLLIVMYLRPIRELFEISKAFYLGLTGMLLILIVVIIAMGYQ